MRNKNWFAVTAFATWIAVVVLIAFTAMPGLASAHTMNRSGYSRHVQQCITSMCKGKDALFCRAAMSSAFKADHVDFEKMRALHIKLKKIMNARRFNKKSFLDLTARMSQVHNAMMRRHTRAFASVAGRLSPKGRRELMEKFFRMSMYHGMRYHSSVEQQHRWFSDLNK